MNLEIPVVRTKIIVPRRRIEILSRPRLLSILENVLELKLLIIAAPAGYGKTSLLVDFAYHTQLPVCWFALDTLDSDPQRFIAHFISAIAHRFPEFGEASIAALNNLDPNTLDLDPVISAIINDAYDHVSEHFIFVLDDYHLVRDNKLIDSFINRFTLEMSENCHLIIASRTLLTLPDLTLLVARSQVAGLSFEELAFMSEEIKQLISVNYHQNITDAAAAELEKQTEGWITGLLLTAQLSPKDSKERLRLARVSGIGLYEYLTQQVFDRQSEEMQLFLMRTSLFEEFDASLCEQILNPALQVEKENWQEKIELVMRDNLFVLPVDDVTMHLRYHHLFHDFLENRMRVSRPEETLQIEKVLAAYYEQKKDWERVFSIYSRLGDVNQVADVIRRAAPSMLLGGRLTMLSDWLELLPPTIKEGRSDLLSIIGTIALIKGETQKSLEVLTRAIDELRKEDKEEDLAIALIRRSTGNRSLGNYEVSMHDAEEAAQICGNTKNTRKTKAEAFRAIGLNYYHFGDLKKALSFLKKSLEIYQELGEEMDSAKCQTDLGIVYFALVQLDESEHAFQESLAFWQTSQNSLWQANLLNNIGVQQHSRGKYEQAASSFERAVSYARLASNPRVEGYSLTSLGDLYRDIRAIPEARQAYLLAHQVSGLIDDQHLNILLTLSESVLERVSGNYPDAVKLIEYALENAQKSGSQYEVNLCKLEDCIVKFSKNDLKDLPLELEKLHVFFESEGFKAESLKTQYYLKIIAMKLKKTSEAQRQLVDLCRSCSNDLEICLVNQLGLETLENLKGFHIPKTEDGKFTRFISDLNGFEESLVHIRRTVRRHSEVIRFGSPKFVIKVFGKCQVKVGDRSVALSEWKTQMARDLFFYILKHPEGVTKEEIGNAFWPETTVDTMRLRFKNSMYRVRRALGGECISFEDDYYRFNRSLEYDYDVEDFQQEIMAAQSVEAVEEKITHYRLAVNYYKGTYLPKLDYEWVLIQREQYHQSFMTAITHLINLYIQTEQFQLAIQYSDRAVEEDSCYEAAYQSAMLAYSALGDRAGVSRQYEKCKTMLKKELNIEPAPQTRNLYKSLMQ